MFDQAFPASRGTVDSNLVVGDPKSILDLSPFSDNGPRYFCFLKSEQHADTPLIWFVGRSERNYPDFHTDIFNTENSTEYQYLLTDGSISHNVVVKTGEPSAEDFHIFGGQNVVGGAADDPRDGIHHFNATFQSMLDGDLRYPERDGTLIFDDQHAGCANSTAEHFCEVDGKLSAAYMKRVGTWYVFLRVNRRDRGGRYVGVIHSTVGPGGPYGPLVQLVIEGYDPDGPGNIYFPAVDPNPIDDSTMLGLFPINEGAEGEANGDGPSYIGASLSCDGVHWSRLIPLVWSSPEPGEGRTLDQPVDGLRLDRDGNVSFWIHFDVDDISPDGPGRLVQYALRRERLWEWTLQARATLPNCDGAKLGERVSPAGHALLPHLH